MLNKTICEFLNGKKSAKIGTLKANHIDELITVSLIPDISNVGTYGIKISNGINSESFRMMYKAKMTISEVIKHFCDYLNIDNPERNYTIEPIKEQKERVKKEVDPLKEDLKRLKAKRFKTRGDEIKIERLEQHLKTDTSKWKPGYGVGWKVTRDQINRGYRIVSVNEQEKTAIIKPVADTGLTVDGTDRMPKEWEKVLIIDLIRDKKYDAAVKNIC
jgi:hypothetical protein